MPNQEDKQDTAHLEQVNADLSASLERCRELLSECREKLSANNNDSAAEGPDQGIKSASKGR